MKNPVKHNPLVSVVVPCYNHEKFVQECIQSIIDQDYKNIELIIIDDGSKDNSVEKIKELIPACQVRFKNFEFRHRPNKGLCATLNEALEWCSGEYLSPLASDDIALSIKISHLCKRAGEVNADAIFGGVKAIGGLATVEKNAKKEILHTFGDLITHQNIPAAPAALIKISSIKNVGGYDEATKLEDWSLWLAMAERGMRLISCSKIVALYRRHENNITNDSELIANERRKIIERYNNRPEYRAALKHADLQRARDLAMDRKSLAFKYYARSFGFSALHFFILIKIITPRSVLKFIMTY